jgi:competence protein ComEC
MSDRVAALVAVVVVAGALVGECLGPSPGGWCLLAALAGAMTAAACGGMAPTARPRLRAVLALIALALVAAALMQRALDGLDGVVAEQAAQEAPVLTSVRLIDDPRHRHWSAQGMARLPDGTIVTLDGRGPAAGRLPLLAAGETAVVSGRLRPLAGWEGRLRWRHAAAGLAVDDVVDAAPPASPGMRLANGLRGLVLSGARQLPEAPAALTAGLLVGDDRELPEPLAADFRVAGLSHLLAVSGANVAFVLALAGPALRHFGLRGRFAGGVAVLALFAAMTRFEPSVLRASAMAGVGLVAAFAGRPARGGRLLALAVAGLVLADPFLIHSLGFGLSVGASAGILALARPLAARLPGPRLLRDGLAVTAAAQIGVAPVALPAFGSLPLIAFPANLLAAPAAAALTLWGFGSGLAGGVLEPLAPGAPGALGVPTRFLSSYLAGVASVAAQFPLAVGGRGFAAVVAVSVLGRLGWGLRQRRGAERLPLPAGCPGPGRPGP